MRLMILVWGIMGSVMAIGIGSCSGLVGVVADVTHSSYGAGEEVTKGEVATVLFGAFLQAVLGLVGSISIYDALGKGRRPGWLGKLSLVVGAGCSVTNTAVAITAAPCHLIAFLLAFIVKPEEGRAQNLE